MIDAFQPQLGSAIADFLSRLRRRGPFS